MILRRPFIYSTPQDIVRIVHFGLQAMAGITDAQYEAALAQVEASKPVIEWRTVSSDEDDARFDDMMYWRNVHRDYEESVLKER